MDVLLDTSQDGGVHVSGPIGAPSHEHFAGSVGEHVIVEPAASAVSARIIECNVGSVYGDFVGVPDVGSVRCMRIRGNPYYHEHKVFGL